MFDVETFIDAVKERPALYDAFHKNYNRKDLRARLWDEIARKMYPDWGNFDIRDKNEKVTILQKKWKSLKDCFNREIRLQRNRDPKKTRKKYEFYDKLSFLHQKDTGRGGATTTAPPTGEIKIKQENPAEPAEGNSQTIRQTSEQPSRKRRRQEEDFPKLLLQQRKAADDSDRLFLLSFVNDLKRLPFATKYWVRMMFSQIMHQAARKVNACQDDGDEFELEVGSPVGDGYLDEFSDGGSSVNLSSPEMYYM